MGMQLIVVTVAFTQQRVLVLRHIGCGMGQRLRQPEANHIASSLISRHGAAHIFDSSLNAAHDDLRGIK